MSKYRVWFRTSVQVDGWSDYRDREYESRTETITVEAKNLKNARKVAIQKAFGYWRPSPYGSTRLNWCDCNIGYVKRLVKPKSKKERKFVSKSGE